MAYCSYCAAVLDPNLPMCSQCGRPSQQQPPAAPAVPPTFTPTPVLAAVPDRPQSVQLGGILYLVACALSLLMLAVLLARYHNYAWGFILIRTFGMIALGVLLVICIWRRQNWARILLALLIAYSTCTLLYSFMMVRSHTLPWTYYVALVEAGLRLVAIYLLFKPESNAWFNRGQPPN
jgi:hypothetical protein